MFLIIVDIQYCISFSCKLGPFINWQASVSLNLNFFVYKIGWMMLISHDYSKGDMIQDMSDGQGLSDGCTHWMLDIDALPSASIGPLSLGPRKLAPTLIAQPHHQSV